MKWWLRNDGRLIFAIAMICFGIQHLLYATSLGPPPAPPWIPTAAGAVFLIGAILIASGASIGASKRAGSAAAGLATLLFLYAVLFYVPAMAAHPRDPGKWTSAFELLAMCGAASVLAGSLQVARPRARARNTPADWAILIGSLLFAVSLLVFGIQHFMYAGFVATLVPFWIPAPLFWAYFVGAAFIAAALSIATGIKAHLAATLLGIMFLLWFLLLHAPRVAAAPHDAKEWTSAFVALAMCGGAFAIARTQARAYYGAK